MELVRGKEKLEINTEILERAIIGCILLNGELIHYAIKAQLDVDHFSYDSLRDIYTAMFILYGKGKPINTIFVAHEIRKIWSRDYIDEEYINQIATEIPGFELFDYYVDELIECRSEEIAHRLKFMESKNV